MGCGASASKPPPPPPAKAELMEKVQGDRFMGLEASKYRVRCVSYGLPEDGFATGMAATIPYFSSPDPMMPEGVAKEVFLTTADETKQFILLFYEAKAEEAIMAQYRRGQEDTITQPSTTSPPPHGDFA